MHKLILALLPIIYFGNAFAVESSSFSIAKKLIEKNCPTCYKKSREEYEKGIYILEDMIDEPMNDAAMLLLAKTYQGYIYGYKLPEAQAKIYLSKQKNIYEKLIHNSQCSSIDLVLGYATILPVNDALEYYDEVLGNRINLFEAALAKSMAIAGNYDLRQTKYKEGKKAIILAYKLATDGMISRHAYIISVTMKKYDMPEMAEEVMRKKKEMVDQAILSRTRAQ